MKKLFVFIAVISIITLSACKDTQNRDKIFNIYNLDFEKIENGFPANWDSKILGDTLNYTISLDSTTVKSGKYAIAIEFKGNSVDFRAITFILPKNYDGKKITLSGYIKTENITEGYAGLWMRIDPQIAFDNMIGNGATGTTDWKKYEITLNMNRAKTDQILIGGLLNGNGKMWIDDLSVTIDGKDVQRLKPYMPKPFPAENDKEFDAGSGIVFPEPDEQKMENLELLGKIWGFLKYNHPAIAEGNYNWDYELFRFLPEYLKTNDNSQRDDLLLKWTNGLGKVPSCKNCQPTPDSAFIKPDLSWIENSDMNRKLKSRLQKIYKNRYQGNHYYIQPTYSGGNPVFSHENNYPKMSYPDTGFRLLALYRYWNMIQYFFPYKYLTDKNWNDVLEEYLPSFIDAEDELQYEQVTARLIGEVCDSHAGLYEGFDKIQASKGYRRIPVRIGLIENKWVVTDCNILKSSDYSDEDIKKMTGLNIGDIITHINGKSVESIVDSIRMYYPASNEAVRMRNIADDILRSNLHTAHIKYISSNQIKERDITLLAGTINSRYGKDTALCYKFPEKDIGYITLENIREGDVPIIKREFINTKGIVIDIRNYPSASVLFLLGSYFVSDTICFVKFTNWNPDNPGEFTFIPSRYFLLPEEETYRGKLVVIVNELTQSHAEFTAMAFRAGDNTTIIGSQTAGADGNISEIFLPGGLHTIISGIGIYYPDGRETQRIGIVPDIEVKPTIKGIREGRDELLEKAIEIIRQE
jgi:C-terminal processing protease CtpA/Prc